MQSKKKVSVIIPVYKVELYLATCIESVLRQTYKNLEIILVDDGSPDRCGEMCDAYARGEERIVVIHKENGGLSDARNAGLAVATGEYITFLDSDDWLALNCVERMVELAENYEADIVTCEFAYWQQGIEPLVCVESKEDVVVLDHDAAVLAWLYKRYYGVAACAKLYSIACMKGISFPKGRLHEDVGTTYKMFLAAAKTVYTREKLYYYRKREESIVNRAFDSRRLDYLTFTREIMKTMAETYPQYMQAAISRHFQGCIQIGCAMDVVDGDLLREIREYARKVILDKQCRIAYRGLALVAAVSPSLAVQIGRRCI